jgi:hypothetical protein
MYRVPGCNRRGGFLPRFSFHQIFMPRRLWKIKTGSIYTKIIRSFMLTPVRTICLRDDAFYGMLDEIIAYIDTKFSLPKENLWITGEEAQKLLNIGRVTLQKLRDEGKIRFSQRDRKNILYDRSSIIEFIESHAKEKF